MIYKEFYENCLNYGEDFYVKYEKECNKLLEYLNININDYNSNNKLFNYLYKKQIHYNELILIVDKFKNILTEKVMSSTTIINILNIIGMNFEKELKNILNNIVYDLKNDADLQKKYDIKRFNNYKDLINQTNGIIYLNEIFSNRNFLNYSSYRIRLY